MTDHSWAELEKQQEKSLIELFASDPYRVAKMTIEQSGLRFDLSKTHLDDAMLSQFAKLAEDNARRRGAPSIYAMVIKP